MAKEITEVGGRHGRGTATDLSVTSPAIVMEPDRRLHEEIAAAQSYRAQAKAANTLRAYTSDWNQFEAWCDERLLDPMPARPEAVATYLASLALSGKADTTIGRHLAAIGWKHRQDGQVGVTSRFVRQTTISRT